ncbi:translocation/assembly module TamB domain-containing protein [Halothiobacillus sp.]|uniref:translocation/assembly module TamB domain-containing protein n=1 Tax=Halothiobacillus sp. TaxID=1891311 RepID=UPI00261A289C|nr:translocation/assembly module TamB domain-containing protein [Halothiobacillus sp.]
MLRWFSPLLQVVGWLIGGLLALVFVIFIGLTATTPGVRWLAGQAQQQVAGLSMGKVEGNLWQGLRIDQLAFHAQDGLSLDIDKAEVALDWRQFWHFSLLIKNLTAKEVVLRLPPPVQSTTPATPLNLSDLPLKLPVGVQVAHLQIDHFTLVQSTRADQNPQTSLTLTTLQADGQADAQAISLKINKIVASLPGQTVAGGYTDQAVQKTTIEGQGAVRVAIATPHQIDGQLATIVALPQGWALAQMTLGGNLAAIKTQVNGRWEGFVTPSATLQADAQINPQRMTLEELHIDTLEGSLCGRGIVDFAPQLKAAIHGQATGLNPARIAPAAAGQVGFDYQLSYAQSGDQGNEAGQDTAQKSTSAQLQFNLSALGGHIAQLPFEGLTVDGAMANQKISLDITHGTLAGGALKAKGELGLTGARPVALSLDLDRAALRDVLAPNGVAAEGAISTHLKVDGSLGIDPLRDAQINFDWSIPSTVLHVPVTATNQKSVRVPLSLALQGRYADQRLDLKQAKINVADASLDAKGRVTMADLTKNTPVDLTVNANIPQLAHLPWRAVNLPDLTGSLDLKTRLTGSVQHPEATVDLLARNLAYKQWQLANLSLNGRVKQQQTSVYDLSLRADRLTQENAKKTADVRLNNLTLDAQGQWPQFVFNAQSADVGGGFSAAQRFRLSAGSPQGQVRLAIDGLLAQIGSTPTLRWGGQIKRLDVVPAPFHGKSIPAWHLQKPADLTLTTQQQTLGKTCLATDTGSKNQSGHLCIDLARNLARQENSKGRLDADLPLALITPWLPVAADLPGRVRLMADGAITAGQAKGTLKLSLPDSEFRLPDILGNRAYPYKNVDLTARVQSGVVNGVLSADVPDLLNIKGGGTVGLTGSKPLALDLKAVLPSVAMLQGFLPQVDGLKGQARADLAVGGTLDQPKPSGRLVVDQLAFTLPDTGVAYDQGTLNAQIDGNGQLVFSGGLNGVVSHNSTSNAASTQQTGVGRLNIQGTGDLAQLPQWQVQAQIQGQDVPVLRLPNLLIDASPDLTLDASKAGARIGGSITLPTVTARIEKLPDAVVKSTSDLVIVGEKKPMPTAAYPVTADIKLILGKAVSLAGMGFSTDLAGTLNLRQRPNAPLAAFGEIDLIRGTYKAYGQNLAVKQGRLQFVGPLGDPGIAATAQRVVGATTVGLNITGTLYQPKTTVFSSPSLPESDALSILLTGKPLSDSGSGDRAMLMNAIAGLGVAQGNDIVRDIGQKFGFDSVGLDTSGGFGDTQLSLGKKIGERLFVRYAVGVVNGLSEIITQYKLSNLFSIEVTTSPDATGGDLIYRIH